MKVTQSNVILCPVNMKMENTRKVELLLTQTDGRNSKVDIDMTNTGAAPILENEITINQIAPQSSPVELRVINADKNEITLSQTNGKDSEIDVMLPLSKKNNKVRKGKQVAYKNYDIHCSHFL